MFITNSRNERASGDETIPSGFAVNAEYLNLEARTGRSDGKALGTPDQRSPRIVIESKPLHIDSHQEKKIESKHLHIDSHQE